MKSKERFIVDFMLGRLARWLRIFGYDTEYADDKSRASLLLRSLRENRTIITRDHRLSSKRAWKLILINDDRIEGQLRQMVEDESIKVSENDLFTRCTICNTPLDNVTDKDSVKGAVPAYVFETTTAFSRCPVCDKIYWPGTHRDLLLKDLTKAGIQVNRSLWK